MIRCNLLWFVSISIILWLRGCQGNFIWKLVMHTLMFWWKPFLRTLIIGLCFQEHELYEEVRLKSSLVLGFLFWELFFSSKFVSSFYLWDNSPSHFYFLNFPGTFVFQLTFIFHIKLYLVSLIQLLLMNMSRIILGFHRIMHFISVNWMCYAKPHGSWDSFPWWQND